MGIFRYDSKYSAPTKEQRERYMRGEREEHTFGKDGEILLVLYDEAAYLKDDTGRGPHPLHGRAGQAEGP